MKPFEIVHPLRQQLDGVGAGRHLPGADEPAPVFGCVRVEQRDLGTINAHLCPPAIGAERDS